MRDITLKGLRKQTLIRCFLLGQFRGYLPIVQSWSGKLVTAVPGPSDRNFRSGSDLHPIYTFAHWNDTNQLLINHCNMVAPFSSFVDCYLTFCFSKETGNQCKKIMWKFLKLWKRIEAYIMLIFILFYTILINMLNSSK